MVFSFFRKDKEPEAPKQSKPRAPAAQPARPAQPAAPRQAEPKTELDMGPITVSDGIEVVDASVESHSEIEEAAILYASDRPTQAIATLVQCIKDHSESKEIQPWLMLFDLYQITGMKQKFEELSMDFVEKFERSPPAWQEKEQSTTAKQPEKAGPGNYFAFTGELSAAAERQFEQLRTIAKNGAVRLDLSKIQSIDVAACQQMKAVLESMCKAGVKIQYSGLATLVNLLKQQTAAGAESDPANWLLLLDLYALQGKQTEFEDLAVEYAVTFEVSPPSWEQLVCRVKAEEVSEPAPPAAERPAEPVHEGFLLSGVLSAASEAKLKELVAYAAARPDVRIDMSQVPRVDFVSIGSFLNTLIEISQGGSKKVYIKGANELINALFSVMGVSQFATILRKKF